LIGSAVAMLNTLKQKIIFLGINLKSTKNGVFFAKVEKLTSDHA